MTSWPDPLPPQFKNLLPEVFTYQQLPDLEGYTTLWKHGSQVLSAVLTRTTSARYFTHFPKNGNGDYEYNNTSHFSKIVWSFITFSLTIDYMTKIHQMLTVQARQEHQMARFYTAHCSLLQWASTSFFFLLLISKFQCSIKLNTLHCCYTSYFKNCK